MSTENIMSLLVSIFLDQYKDYSINSLFVECNDDFRGHTFKGCFLFYNRVMLKSLNPKCVAHYDYSTYNLTYRTNGNSWTEDVMYRSIDIRDFIKFEDKI